MALAPLCAMQRRPESMACSSSTTRPRNAKPLLARCERMAQVARVASGYVYYVSLKGVTGSGTLDTAAVEAMLPRIRKHVSIPVGVGFGIRDAATAQAIGKVADAVVIGSRIIQLLDGQPHEKVVPVAVDFLRGIRKALDA